MTLKKKFAKIRETKPEPKAVEAKGVVLTDSEAKAIKSGLTSRNVTTEQREVIAVVLNKIGNC